MIAKNKRPAEKKLPAFYGIMTKKDRADWKVLDLTVN